MAGRLRGAAILADSGGARPSADVRASGVASDLLIVPPARAARDFRSEHRRQDRALKATGLLALMAQAGFISVDPGSRFTPFRTIFADIGDDQSTASLSTFRRELPIVEMERPRARARPARRSRQHRPKAAAR
jgi:hypothetical protein